MDSLTLSTGTLLFKSIPTKFEKESIYSYNLLDSKTEKCKHASWFGLTHDKAEYYRKKSTSAKLHVYRTIVPTKYFLVNTTHNAEIMRKKLLDSKPKQLKVFFSEAIPEKWQKHFEKYEYLTWTRQEKAIFEYDFAFGLTSVEHQIIFLKLILKLQEYKLVAPTRKMENNNIFSQFLSDPYAQRIVRQLINTKHTLTATDSRVGQRFSLYNIDIHVLHNLCLVLPKSFAGYIFLHQPSVWHTEMMDTTEVALFNSRLSVASTN